MFWQRRTAWFTVGAGEVSARGRSAQAGVRSGQQGSVPVSTPLQPAGCVRTAEGWGGLGEALAAGGARSRSSLPGKLPLAPAHQPPPPARPRRALQMPRGLEEGILRVSLGQRAKLFCSPAFAAHPRGDPSVPVGVPAVFEVQLKEIVSWTTVGEEVWRMKLNGACTCVSTLIKCPGASSLAALFPDGGPPSPPPTARLPTSVAAALAAAPLPVPAGVGLQQHPAA